MRRRTAVLVVCGLLVTLPIAFTGWYGWDSARNRGFEFGYFGTFNRVQHALTAIPGITITGDFANHDITLEEFGFHITTSAGVSLHLAFEESDPIRELSGQQLTAALITRIEQKTTSTDAR